MSDGTTESAAQRTEALARKVVPLLRPTRPPPPAVRMPPVRPEDAARAQDALAVLEEVVPNVRDDTAVARLFFEIGTLLGFPLGERRVALEALRQAHRRWRAPHVVREYRKAALRAQSNDEALVALEAEIELTTGPEAQSSLLTARALLLEKRGEMGAARGAYSEAASRTDGYLPALEALERLASDPRDAARWAKAQSQATSDPSVAAEHAARAATHLLETQDPALIDEARELARNARVHAPSSPRVLRALEAALARRGVDSELPALRETQLIQGAVSADEGWLDLAIVARYRLNDAKLTRRALMNLLEEEELNAPLRRFAESELSEVLGQLGRHGDRAKVDRERAMREAAGMARALVWANVGRLQERHLGDDVAAAEAYRNALAEDPQLHSAIRPSLRIATQTGDTATCLSLHEREADAVGPQERPHALFDAATLLSETEDGQPRALGLLVEAYDGMPRHFGVLELLERLLRSAGDRRGLLSLHRRQVDLSDDPARRAGLLRRIARLYEETGDTTGAIETHRKIVALGVTETSDALERLASLLDEEGEEVERIEVLSRLAERSQDPEVAASWFERLGAAHLARGDARAAVASYRRAFGLASAEHPVFLAATRALERQGLFEELVQLLAPRVPMLEGSAKADILIRIADARAYGLGDTQGAVEALERALETAPDASPARDRLRVLFRERAEWAELRAVDDTEPTEDAVVALRRAALAEACSDDEAARQHYAHAIELGVVAARLSSARTGGRRTSAPPSLEGMWTHLEQRFDADDSVAEASLAWLISRTIDAKLRSHLAAQRAVRLDRLDRREEALALRREALEARSRDPLLLTEVEVALEAAGDHPGQIQLYQQRLNDPHLDDLLAASFLSRLGQLYEAIGQKREAVDAFERALELDPEASLAGRLALVRLHRALGDETRYQVAIMALSQSLPAGPLRATALRRLATHLENVGDFEAAVVNYEQVLMAHPTDATSLAALERILPALGEDDRLIDPLMRALTAEEDAHRRAIIGSHLAVRLILRGRFDPARDAIYRVLEKNPRQLEALMLNAELHEHEGNLEGAYATLCALLDMDLEPWVRIEAVRRAVHLAADLGREGEAETLAKRLGATTDLSALDTYIEVHARLGGWEKVAQALRERLDRTEDEAQRSAIILHLAGVQEEHLGDPKAALSTLGQSQGPPSEETVEEVLRLGERTNRWDLAAEALENALAAGNLDPDFEVAVRKRLASLLEGPLDRPDQAIEHYERIVELDPSTGVRQRLAELADDPRAAIDHLRALLATKPDDAEQYRQLRLRFLDAGIEDGAFCAEAVLVGLGAANEEEEYFYRRRRARLVRELPPEPLPDDVKATLAGSLPLIEALEALAPALREVFPIDLAAYGIDDALPASSRCGDAVRNVAAIFETKVHVIEVPGRLAPTTEPGLRMRGETRPAVLLPRSLSELVRREQLFLAGVLVGRIAFQGVLFDAARIAPTSMREIGYLLDAARVTFGSASPRFEGAVYDDLRKRLRGATVDRAKVKEALEALPSELDLDQLTRDLDVATARCGILTAIDPSIAVRGLRDHATIFARGPLDAVHAIPFAVSQEFLTMRKRMEIFR